MELTGRVNKVLSLVALAAGVQGVSTSSVQATEEIANKGALNEVVITARKRTENLQEVPISVSAVTAEDLAISGAVNIADIQAQIPGLTAYAARGTSSTLTAYIRGIGQSDPLFGVEPGVGLYLDDVYIARPQGALLEIFDVERIEVLRGPQGTLYGRNTIGGAIKYITKDLNNDSKSSAKITVGNYDRRDVSVALAVPLIEDELFGRVGVLSTTRDGFGENQFDGSDLSDKQILSGNLALQWQPNDDLNIKFAADATKDTSAPRGGERLLENPNEARFTAALSGMVASVLPGVPVFPLAAVDGFVAANNIQPLPVSNERFDTDSGLIGARNDTETKGASLTVQYDLNELWQLKSISAYRDGDTDATIDFDLSPFPISDVFVVYHDEQFTQEFQFNYDNGDNWQVVTGLYYIDGEAGAKTSSIFSGLALPAGNPLNPFPVDVFSIIPIVLPTEGDIVTESYSVYGEANWQITDRLGLSFGGRYTWEEKEVNLEHLSFKDEEDWNNFSPKLGIDYKLSDDVLLYISVSEGFKSGGYNIRANATIPESFEPYDEETVTAYEVGFKSTLFDRLTLNVAYFYSDYEDIQLSIFSQASDGSFFGDFANAGEAVIQGVEIEFVASLTDEWRVNGNAAYIDAEYKEFISGGVDISEQQEFTNTPQWTATLNSTYDVSLGDVGNLLAYIGFNYRDEVIPTTDLSPIVTQGDYTTVDASLTFLSADEQWRVSLEGRNLNDTEYRTTGYDISNLGSRTVQGFYGDPRTYALTVEYSF